MVVEGYKAFLCDNGKLHSRFTMFQFEIGKTYNEEQAILCQQGFHYCKNLFDVFEYYPSSSAVVCKVTDLSAEDSVTDGNKSCTKKLRIDSLLNEKYFYDNFKSFVEFRDGRIYSPSLTVVLNGTKKKLYNQEGELHSENDLPAVEIPNSMKQWYKNDKLHRDGDLPAVEYVDGTKEWWLNGKRHRSNDLPAIIDKDGTKEWFRNGWRHRDNNLPAIVTKNGMKAWFKNGWRQK